MELVYQVSNTSSHDLIKNTHTGIRMLDGVVTDIKEAKSFGYRVQHNDIFSCR